MTTRKQLENDNAQWRVAVVGETGRYTDRPRAYDESRWHWHYYMNESGMRSRQVAWHRRQQILVLRVEHRVTDPDSGERFWMEVPDYVW